MPIPAKGANLGITSFKLKYYDAVGERDSDAGRRRQISRRFRPFRSR